MTGRQIGEKASGLIPRHLSCKNHALYTDKPPIKPGGGGYDDRAGLAAYAGHSSFHSYTISVLLAPLVHDKKEIIMWIVVVSSQSAR